MTSESERGFPVVAFVPHWIEGQYGTYGHAEIVAGDVPTSTALYNVKTLHFQPQAGEPFRCKVAFSRNRWRVVGLSYDNLPDRVERVRGTVDTRPDRSLSLTVIPASNQGVGAQPIALGSRVLGNAGIHSIVPGSEVVVAVERAGRDFHVTELHAPSPLAAVGGLERAAPGALVEEIAFAIRDWDAEMSHGNNVAFAVSSLGARVAAKVWLTRTMLGRLGIRRVVRAALPCKDTPEASRERIARWSETLRFGTLDELASLRIDRLLVLVQPIQAGTQLGIERVLGPARLRTPGLEREVVDWVAGVVRSVKDPEPSIPDRRDVWIEFQDSRLGSGEARARVPSTLAEACSLTPDTQVVVRLESRGRYWNIARIHRSIPQIGRM